MRTPLTVALALSLSACTPNLLGKWRGEVDCGNAARFDFEMELDRKVGDSFQGTAVIEDSVNCAAGVLCDLEFDVELTILDAKGSAFRLDADLDDCEVTGPGGSQAVTCGELEDLEYQDGEIDGKYEEPGLRCDVELER